jgi:4-aminobutyrate aminotransferase-like enzyme
MSNSETLDLLRRYESPNITFFAPQQDWPIVWEKARGMHVWDAEGKKYLDFTAAFGVAAGGHSNPKVVRAAQRQAKTLLHAMGDVHPHPLKGQLLQELSRITYERWSESKTHGRGILCNSGFEAIEAALKTAHLATGKPGVIAFEGAYHGLGYGALTATSRAHFRKPFQEQLASITEHVPFPASIDKASLTLESIDEKLRTGRFGAILFEPIQGRGGIREFPNQFLQDLVGVAHHYGALLVADEIFTGFGRTGKFFAVEEAGIVPDLICLGKALTGGFPLSACVGEGEMMIRAWPPSSGEAIHTSTFLGHPVGCAMALAQIQVVESLLPSLAQKSRWFCQELEKLHSSKFSIAFRGRGLMLGLHFTGDAVHAGNEVLHLVNLLLKKGFIFLPEGEQADVLALTPPLIISRGEIRDGIAAIQECLVELEGGA